MTAYVSDENRLASAWLLGGCVPSLLAPDVLAAYDAARERAAVVLATPEADDSARWHAMLADGWRRAPWPSSWWVRGRGEEAWEVGR